MASGLPRTSFGLPWFMYDLYNKQLITSKIIPGDIRDTKQIILTEVPIPGLNYQPIQPAGGGNRKISFTIPLIRRDPVLGNVGLLKQYDLLRNRTDSPLQTGSSLQFGSTPKVLFYWGTGSVPLVYWVSKCDVTHRKGWTNAVGLPQYSEIQIELILDERHPLYKAEEMFRRVAARIAGVITPAAEMLPSYLSGRRPY